MIGKLFELQRDYDMTFESNREKVIPTKKGELFILIEINRWDALLYSQLHEDYAKWSPQYVSEESEFFKEV